MKQAYQNTRALKQKQRLGTKGGALSLDAFVKAKSRPRLNPSEIIKKRQYYENAKKVKKYKTLLKHLPEQQHPAPTSIPKAFSDDEAITEKEDGFVTKTEDDKAETGGGIRNGPVKSRKKLKKGKNTLIALREEFEKKRKEEQRLKEERDNARKLREEAQRKASQNRKDLKAKMFKKTRHGQPLMKHRLEHILDIIQQQ